MEIIKNNKQLLALEADEALAEVKQLGYNFTINELKEFAKVIKTSGELSFEVLEDVAGGADINPGTDKNIFYCTSVNNW